MATTGMRFASILSVAITAAIFLPLQNPAMADDQRHANDPLSNKSPAQQQRQEHIKRKLAPQYPPPQGIAGGPANDDCENAIDIQTFNTLFSTIGATTDGPPHPICLAFGDDQVNQDIWFNYTASKDDLLNISLCLSGYDTRIAVYEGCECPVSDANILMCNDDSCGLQSQLIGLKVIEGHCYKIRVGGYDKGAGEGTLMFSIWGDRLCAGGNHDCCVTGTPGCNDLSCCEVVCSQDAFCCDVEWDLMCVQLADKTCAKPCPSPCSKDNHPCNVTGSPGCNDIDCCKDVCAQDPFCCDTAWDQICVDSASIFCIDRSCYFCPPGATIETEICGTDTNGGCNSLSVCSGPFQDCCVATGMPGCSDPTCQTSICAADPFCCDTAWDGICAAAACADRNCQCEPASSPYQPLDCEQTICGTFWSSTSVRDTDWYSFNIIECGTIATWTLNSEFPCVAFFVNECPPVVIASGTGNGCPTIVSAQLVAGQYVAFVAPAAFLDVPCESGNNDYVGTLFCEIPCAADIQGPGGGPNGVVDVDDLLKVINNWGACK